MNRAVPLLVLVACTPLPDPVRSAPPEDTGLTDVSADLNALLEGGELEGACRRWSGRPEDRAAMLLCGKSMFFYESFETIGAPASILDHLATWYPDVMGPSFEALGLVADPFAPNGRPLGLAPTRALDEAGTVPGYAFTCASCHFGRLPDGRYAVGAANHEYEYGKHVLALGLYPLLALGVAGPDHAPEALEALAPLLAAYQADTEVQAALAEAVLPLAAVSGASLAWTPELERWYATWPPGTQDFTIAPLPLEDEVHTISKIIPLWDLPRAEAVAGAEMPHAMLAWTGAAPSLMAFVEGFATVGGEAPWPKERLAPLVEYVYSLRAPANPAFPDARLAREGQRLFVERCQDCHDGPAGSGRRLFDYEEIGTDDAMKRWMDPDLDGVACCGVDFEPTHAIKSPRLTGLWAQGRFLHNGALDSLEALFCLSGERGAITEPAYGDGGHRFTCEGLAEDEKRALMAYLLR